MNDIMKPHFRKEYGEAEVKKLEKRVDRLEEIKNKVETWESDMILNREEAEYLLQRLERYEQVLKDIYEVNSLCDRDSLLHALSEINKLAEEALREDE